MAITAARIRQAQAGSDLAGSQLDVQAAVSANSAGLYHESLSNPNSLAERIFGNQIEYGSIRVQGRWICGANITAN